MTHRWIHMGLAVLAVSGLYGCSKATGPSEDQLTAYLETRNGEDWNVDSIRFDTYMDESGSSGRASCAGEFILTTDLHSFDSDAVSETLKQAVGDRYHFHAQQIGRVTGVRVAHPAGTKRPFKAEVFFRKTVDDWDLEGDIDFEYPPGTPAHALPEKAILVGGPEFQDYVKRVVEQRQLFEQPKKEQMAALEKFFTPNAEIVWETNLRGGNPEEMFVIRIAGPVQWDSNTAYDAKKMTVPGEVSWLTDGRWGQPKFKAGDTVPGVVSVELVEPGTYGYPEIGDRWSASINIGMAGNGPPYRIALVLWRGEHFQGWPTHQNRPADSHIGAARRR